MQKIKKEIKSTTVGEGCSQAGHGGMLRSLGLEFYTYMGTEVKAEAMGTAES